MNAGKPFGNDPLAALAEPRGKSLGDYLAALRRRFWLVLLIALLVGGGGTLFTLFVQGKTYVGNAVVRIEPPKVIVEGVRGLTDSKYLNYFETTLEQIANRTAIEQIIAELKLSAWGELYGVEDPAYELAQRVRVKRRKTSSIVDVSLESGDAKLAADIVNKLVQTFIDGENANLRQDGLTASRKVEEERKVAESDFVAAGNERQKFQEANLSFVDPSTTREQQELARLMSERGAIVAQALVQKQRLAELESQKKLGRKMVPPEAAQAVAAMEAGRAEMQDQLEYYRRTLQPTAFARNRSVRDLRNKLAELEEKLASEVADETDGEIARVRDLLANVEAEAKKWEAAVEEQRGALTKLLPKQREFDKLRGGEAAAGARLGQLSATLAAIKARPTFIESQIVIEDRAFQSTTPIRPLPWLQIPLFVLGGLLLGSLAVMGLAAADRALRTPEQAARELDWPLLGVVPRVNRRELSTARGKMLLASELPGTPANEAFRNLRMGLLGAEGTQRLRSVLVTSAGPGEGKTTIAANLAAACARAGETVCLVDLDLRAPGLGDFFEIPDDAPGLADVLEGHAPWQRAALDTEVPNLTLIAAGGAEGIPFDILGTVEMHDLLQELTEKFDRVVLDGPAALGLADARAVGRFADGVVFVVMAGVHDARPLRRIRQLFDHEGLRPAGLVMNGLRERHEDVAVATSRTRRPHAAPRPKSAVRATAPAATPAEDTMRVA